MYGSFKNFVFPQTLLNYESLSVYFNIIDMKFGWLLGKKVMRVRRLRRRTSASAKHYEAHKERARILVHERLVHWNQFYGLPYKRVAIRNQRSRWGSCSTKGNLNFNYRLVFLPVELVDYVIVHELCHLKHFNHAEEFWNLVETTIQDYCDRKSQLHEISKNMNAYMSVGVRPLHEHVPEQISLVSDTVPAL